MRPDARKAIKVGFFRQMSGNSRDHNRPHSGTRHLTNLFNPLNTSFPKSPERHSS
jgi:hypothetical protein